MHKAAKVKATMPDNIAIQKFDFEYFAKLDPQQQSRLLKCLKTGWENPDSGLGCYAMAPSDYDEFAPFFDAVCQEYHKASADATHESEKPLTVPLSDADVTEPVVAEVVVDGDQIQFRRLLYNPLH